MSFRFVPFALQTFDSETFVCLSPDSPALTTAEGILPRLKLGHRSRGRSRCSDYSCLPVYQQDSWESLYIITRGLNHTVVPSPLPRSA